MPVTVAVIFFLLYSMFGSFKWAGLAMVSLLLSPIGALLALYFTGTHFSVSSGIGTLALFGVAVETGVIMIEYINQLRVRGYNIHEAAVEGAVLRLTAHHDDNAGRDPRDCFRPPFQPVSDQIRRSRSRS